MINIFFSEINWLMNLLQSRLKFNKKYLTEGKSCSIRDSSTHEISENWQTASDFRNPFAKNNQPPPKKTRSYLLSLLFASLVA